jgi:hypothetical protein
MSIEYWHDGRRIVTEESLEKAFLRGAVRPDQVSGAIVVDELSGGSKRILALRHHLRTRQMMGVALRDRARQLLACADALESEMG